MNAFESGSFDVVVCGAGPAGAATALLVARAGARVILLDRSRFPREKSCGEAFGPGVRAFLLRHGLALPPAARTLLGMRLTAAGTEVAIPFRGPAGDAAGFAACRRDLDALLVEAAVAAGATLVPGAAVVEVAREGRRVTAVRIARAGRIETLAAPLTVGAGGLACPVAKALGGRRVAGRVAFLAHLDGVTGLGPYGEAHVFGRGFTGIAPLGDDRANVAVVHDLGNVQARVRGLANRSRAGGAVPAAEALWKEGVERCGLAPRVARAHRAGPLRTTGPLGFRSGALAAGGAVVVGDAGGFVDPFTGDGVAVALRTAELAAPVILAALDRGGASATALRPYAAAHRREVRPRLLFDHVLALLARRPAAAASALRALARNPALAERLLAVPADLAPPASLLDPALLFPLLRALVHSPEIP